jgi:type II secretory pathway component PulF
MQSIIVYRNPLEAAFWESMSGAAIFPVMMGIVVYFAVFLVLQLQVVERFTNIFDNARKYATYAAMAVSAVAGVATIYKMWV